MRRLPAVLLTLLLPAGLLAGCENPFATTFAPAVTARQLPGTAAERIELQEVEDFAAAEADLSARGWARLGGSRFESYWWDPAQAREQAAAVGADRVLIGRTPTHVDSVEHKETRTEVEHIRPRPGAPVETVTREVPVYTYEDRQWYEVRASFWRRPG